MPHHFHDPDHYTAADRQHIQHFAGPNETYPIVVPQDVADAARLYGHAADPATVKANIITIAHELGAAFVAQLPTAWADATKGDRMNPIAQPLDATPEDEATARAAILGELRTNPLLREEVRDLLERAEAPDDDDEDEPEADEDDAASPATDAATPAAPQHRAAASTAPLFYAPLTRIDDEKREIEGVLSSESVDTYGTVFDYDAMKAAVNRWPGNIREQHDLKKAVGRRVAVRFDDEHRRVILRARISRGAEDTWHKIKDGVLTGYSIGVSRYAPPTQRTIGNKLVPVYTDYDLGEASVVDAPSNPDAAASGLTIYRADGFSDPAFADLDEVAETPTAAPEVTETPVADDVAPERAVAAQPPIAQPFRGLAGIAANAPVGPLAQAAGLLPTGPGLLAQAAASPQQRAITTASGLDGHDPNDATPPTADTIVRADGSHAPMTGTHKHTHPAYGSQGDDTMHAHEHTHQDDADHDHTHGERAVAAPVTRAGQRISADTRTGLHEAALAILRTCNCPACQECCDIFDPDEDGDDDLDAAGDTDQDMTGMGRARQTRLLRRATNTAIAQAVAPILQRFQALAAQFATTPDLSRMTTQLDEQRAVLTAVEGLVRKIAAQEKPGGPVLRAADKTLALGATTVHDASSPPLGGTLQPAEIAAMQRMAQAGQLTADQQKTLATLLFQQQYHGQ